MRAKNDRSGMIQPRRSIKLDLNRKRRLSHQSPGGAELFPIVVVVAGAGSLGGPESPIHELEFPFCEIVQLW
jgi:hypothetical protein